MSASSSYRPTPEQIAATAAGNYGAAKLSAVTEAKQLCERAQQLLAPWRRLRLRSLRDAIQYQQVEIDRMKALPASDAASLRRPKRGSSAQTPAIADEVSASRHALDLLTVARKKLVAFQYYPMCQLDNAIGHLQVEVSRVTALVGPILAGKSSDQPRTVDYSASKPDEGASAVLALQTMRNAKANVATCRVHPTHALATAIGTTDAFPANFSPEESSDNQATGSLPHDMGRRVDALGRGDIQ